MLMKEERASSKIPLLRAILEVIASKPEGLSESRLEAVLKKEYGMDFSRAEMYHALMKLELQGLIQVEFVGKELSIKPSQSLYQS